MLFFGVLAPKLGFDRSTTGALIITAGISSISFVGFPIFEMLYGKTGLQTGILMSQAGSFVVCGTLGIITASYYGSAKPNLSQIFKDIFSFPPFVSFCIAIVINLLGIQLPDFLASILQKIASPFSVIALISVGLQISFDFDQIPLKPLLWGLGFKLLIAPIIIFVLYVLVLDQHNTIGHICVLGAGIGSMNTATIIAINHKLNPKLASMMVGVGIPLSLFTLFLIYVFL
jgi:predicted permease